MLIKALYKAIMQLFSLDFQKLFWQIAAISLSLMALLLIVCFKLGQYYLAEQLGAFWPSWAQNLSYDALSLIIVLLASGFLSILLIAPISAFVGSFFTDKAFLIIESKDFPQRNKGQNLSLGYAIILALEFLLLNLAGNFLILFLLFFPLAHFLAFYLLNAYLLGREYFLLAALRYHDIKAAKKLYKKQRWPIFLAGLIITLFLSLPVLNLITGLFAASFMAYFYHFSEFKDGAKL